jgi:two-component system, cell cycle sensor histidine kinase PleC
MRARIGQLRRQSLLSDYSADMGSLISRKRAQDALRAASLESAMASRAKSEFLAQMSHELRTPLNAIIGFSELIDARLKRGGDVEKSAEYAQHILYAGKHLLQIINDILDISKIEAGRFTLHVEPQPMWELVEASVAIVRPRIEDKRQILTVNVPENLPFALVDPLRIKQVIINLLSNACKFTDEAGKIGITATNNDDGIHVAVSDTGRGMAADEISQAMRPFVQIESTYNRNHEGTGLGLPIAKALILQHGGKFHVTSARGVGTTVAFTVPEYKKL